MIAGWSNDSRRWRVALYYGIASVVTGSLGIWIGSAGLVLLWPAASLLLVAANYAALGPSGFGKAADGRMRVTARWLLAPYVLGARIHSRLWTRRDPNPVRVSNHVWIGRFPSRKDVHDYGIRNVVDLTAELPARASPGTWHCIPMLDLITPSPQALRDAAREIERRRIAGPVLVCCALGYGRSAAALVTWMLRYGRAATIEEAVVLLKRVRHQAILRAVDLEAIAVAASDDEAAVEALAA